MKTVVKSHLRKTRRGKTGVRRHLRKNPRRLRRSYAKAYTLEDWERKHTETIGAIRKGWEEYRVLRDAKEKETKTMKNTDKYKKLDAKTKKAHKKYRKLDEKLDSEKDKVRKKYIKEGYTVSIDEITPSALEEIKKHIDITKVSNHDIENFVKRLLWKDLNESKEILAAKKIKDTAYEEYREIDRKKDKLLVPIERNYDPKLLALEEKIKKLKAKSKYYEDAKWAFQRKKKISEEEVLKLGDVSIQEKILKRMKKGGKK